MDPKVDSLLRISPFIRHKANTLKGENHEDENMQQYIISN